MQDLHPIPAAEMIAIFLRAELGSSRFEPTILAILERDGRERSLIEHPDLTSPADNEYRAQVLSEHRGYGRDEDGFTSVPPDVRWYRGQATRLDLERVRYIDYDYWTELSGGTRLAMDATERIRQGIEALHIGNGAYWYLAEALKAGACFPELILVGADERGPHVLLEGHVRLTAYVLVPDCIPGLGIAIVGWFVVARIFGHKQLGIAFGLALGSHIMLDIIQHEPNIRLAWFLTHPTLGFNLGAIPMLDFAVETAYAVFCWWYFGGSKKLLAVLLGLSLTNLPLMLSGEGSATSLATNHFILPTVILGQILMTFGLVYVAARSRGNQLGAVEAVPVDRLEAIQIPA